MKPPFLVVVVGLGNIGSHLVPHLARLFEVKRITLIDPDSYEIPNIVSQEITWADAGRPKVEVQARRLRALHRGLTIRTWRSRVQDVPLGRLRADAIFGCLDTREARRCLNQAAWRLGIPLLDAGVRADGMLARVDVFVPGSRDAPCLECAWSDEDYEQLEVAYACGATSTKATGAPSALGALAASLQAVEFGKLARGEFETLAADRRVMFDARHHVHTVTRIPRNPECRFDHGLWQTQDAPLAAPEYKLLDLPIPQGSRSVSVSVAERPFATRLRCTDCGSTADHVCLADRIPRKTRTCTTCGGERIAPGFDLRAGLRIDNAPASVLERSLLSLGLRRGDVFALNVVFHGGGDAQVHYECA
jgi:molybdopterin/thiamine biosynthesis adenylyltransferase